MNSLNTIKVFNLNIWNYNEPWDVRRELIAEAIRREEADLVALQEIRYLSSYEEDPRHQAEQIAERLSGYSLIWQPAHYYQSCGPDEKWEGLAILSHLPVVDRRYLLLSRDEGDSNDTLQRIVLGAEVRTPGGAFWLFTTHFPLSARARQRVVCEAYDFVVGTAGPRPFVLTGDFNAEPDSAPIHFLTGRLALERQHGGLVDAWALLHPNEPGFTQPRREPRKRIDYFFVSPPVRIYKITLAATEPDAQGVYPSDHYGLVAKLEFQ